MVESSLPASDDEETPNQKRLRLLAEPFYAERELAFFVVQIGMSVSDYRSLTDIEKMFIRKEHESKFMVDTTWMRNAMLNAYSNANRKKRQSFIELFPKKIRVDKEYNENAMAVLEEINERDGKSWVDRVLKANGIKKKGGK